MKKSILSVVINSAIAAMTYFGFVADIEGAQNVMEFFVWAVCLPLGLLALTGAFQREMATSPPATAFRLTLSRCVSWGVLVVMVWQGYIATGIAYGFYLLCGAVSLAAVKKIRDQAVQPKSSFNDA